MSLIPFRSVAECGMRNADWGKKIKKFATANLSAGGFDVLFLPYSLVPEKL
jgi:hypothetical protein